MRCRQARAPRPPRRPREFPLPIACTSVGFDAAGTRLLVGADDKQVLLYETLPPGDTPPRKWTAGKKVGCVAFSPDGLFALWSDLFGECYSVALSEADATPQLVLGHLSPVSHLIFSSNGSALLTADREGHIRSSHWPHAFVIECYYLWHSTPLSLVLPLKSCPLVLSATSEGKEICVWKAHSGALLDRVAAATCINPPKMEMESVFDNPQCSLTLSIACACEIVSQSLVAFAYPTGIAFCKISMIRMLPLPSCWRRKGRGGLTTSIQIGAILRPWRTAQNLAYSARSQRAKFQTLSRVLAVQKSSSFRSWISHITQLDLGLTKPLQRSFAYWRSRARTHRRRARRQWLLAEMALM